MISPDLHRLSRRLKIRHLSLLSQIDQLGSLTRVAAALGISQPAATKALAEIESIFGAPLFTRSAQGMEATAMGRLAIVRARHMLQDLETWTREVEALRAGQTAHLHLGAVPYISGGLLTGAIAQLYERHGVTVTLHRATTDHLLQLLRDRELDCMIGRASSIGDMSDLTHQVLYRQRPRIIAHPRLAVAMARRRPDWTELAAMKWVLPSTNTPTRQMLNEQFIRVDVQPPQPMLETYSPDVIEGMLGMNDSLLSLVPEDLALELCQRGVIALVAWDFDWELPPVSLIRRVRDMPLAAEDQLAQLLVDLCGGPLARPPAPEARPGGRAARGKVQAGR
jgi:DNA-binding transcriptional LysR family regulator